MPISENSHPHSKNRYAVAALFFAMSTCNGEVWRSFQKLIEPVIISFIESMEPGVPRVEIESSHKENSCLVLMCFKKASLKKSICSKHVSTLQVRMT